MGNLTQLLVEVKMWQTVEAFRKSAGPGEDLVKAL